MIGIVDYRAGNLTSVARALRYLGEDCRITDDPEILATCSHIIFPGVGAAGEAMANLRERKLDYWLRTWVASGIPVLGICLGTQVIFSSSEENDTTCLDIVPGTVKRFPECIDPDGRPLKIPHMGWNQVHFTRKHPVFHDIPDGAEFYFVHSYYPDPAPDSVANPVPDLAPKPADDGWVIGQTEYGLTFCSAIARNNLVAVQFHPEKSGRPGLQILANFCRWGGRDAE